MNILGPNTPTKDGNGEMHCWEICQKRELRGSKHTANYCDRNRKKPLNGPQDKIILSNWKEKLLCEAEQLTSGPLLGAQGHQ